MLMETSNKLVLYNAPVVETGLSIQFSDLPNWQSVHHGLYYELIRSRYPKFQQVIEQPPIILSFPLEMQQQVLRFSPAAAPGCAEYYNSSETALVRVQKNRFSYHWIRGADGSYPHYDITKIDCINEFNEFVRFCDAEDIGLVSPTLGEVAYVNHIPLANDGDLAKIMLDAFGYDIGTTEVITFNRTFVLGERRGRLYAEISVGSHEQNTILLFKLTSRVRHEEGDVGKSIQYAHDELISIFKAITNAEYRRKAWGSNE